MAVERTPARQHRDNVRAAIPNFDAVFLDVEDARGVDVENTRPSLELELEPWTRLDMNRNLERRCQARSIGGDEFDDDALTVGSSERHSLIQRCRRRRCETDSLDGGTWIRIAIRTGRLQPHVRPRDAVGESENGKLRSLIVLERSSERCDSATGIGGRHRQCDGP